MRKLQPVLATSLGLLVGLVAFVPITEARGGGGGFGGGHGFGGGYGGGFAAPRGYGGNGGYRGYGGRAGFADGYGYGGYNGGRNNFGPGGNGYGPYPGHRNPWANNWGGWGGVYIDPGSIPYSVPATNTNVPTPPPNDCNYLFQKAIDSNSPYMWTLFNACSHGR